MFITRRIKSRPSAYCLLGTLISSIVLASPETQPRREITPPDRLSVPHPLLPEPSPSIPETAPTFVLPPVKPSQGLLQQRSATSSVWVDKIQLRGNTILTNKDLRPIVQPYEKRWLSNTQLQQLRLQLSRYYIDRGYINSGAIIPDQTIARGIIYIQMIEGRLDNISISGNTHLNSHYLRDRIILGVTTPLNVNTLQQRLQMLKQDPLVEQINARLQPGIRAGESDLNIRIQESRPYQIGFTASNNRSPSIGAESAQLWAIHRNITGLGDRLYASYSLTEGLNNVAASYSIPLNANDTRLEFSFNRSDSRVIEPEIKQLNRRLHLSSQFESYQLAVTHPLLKTPQETLSLTVGFQHLNSQTFIDGRGRGLSLGVESNGKSRISALRVSQDWLRRGAQQVIALRSRFSIGIDAFGITRHHQDLPDGLFFVWLGQFQWVRRSPLWNSLIIVRTDLQFASEALLPLEKFSIGGAASVRGYRENEQVRDNGLSTSLEWRVPVFRLPLPYLTRHRNEGQIHLAPFIDFGWSENIDQPSPTTKTLVSAGIGLRWNPIRRIHSQLYWAYPFRKIHNNRHDLQDSGIHFRLSVEFL